MMSGYDINVKSIDLRQINEAYKRICVTESAKIQEKFDDKCGRKIFLNIVRKSSTDEWVVKVHVDGKYNEDATYYTDDKEDAISTMAHMKKQFIEKDCFKK